jgi:hypothetical protein
MPSVSKKQHNFMAAVAKNPGFAKKVGIPRSVGEEFLEADKGKKFSMGGKLQSRGNAPGLTRSTSGTKSGITQVQGGKNQINKQETRWGSIFGQPKGVPNTTLNKYAGKKEGGTVKHSDMSKDKPMMKKIAGEAVKGHEKKMHKMAKGGVTRADGCVTKGHTKGKMIKMAGGGSC